MWEDLELIPFQEVNMKLKIVSDGTIANTKVIDEETGKALENVASIYWFGKVQDEFCEAVIRFTQVPVEVRTDRVVEDDRPEADDTAKPSEDAVMEVEEE